MLNHLRVHVVILASSVAFTTTHVVGQTGGLEWDPVVDCNMPGQGGLRPRIAMNSNADPVVLWGRMAPNSNFVAVGTGTGFMPPAEVSTAGCVPAVADWMGSSIASSGNTMWVVMKATPEESKPCYVRRSDDGGLSWGDTLRVDPLGTLVSRFPSIDVDDPDRPLVQYMEFDSGYYGARQVVTHFAGGGFVPPVQVSDPFAPGEVCDCCPNQVVADGNRALALYRNAGSNIRVMWGAASEDMGTTFPIGAQVDGTTWNLSACPSSGPDGYLVGDSIRYVWMSGAENGFKVYLGSAHATDLALAPPQYVHALQPANLQQNFPRIAGSGDTLGVVWEQNLLGERDIFFSWSTSGVAGLSSPEQVNTVASGSQRTPDIAFADGSFHIVWSEQGNQVRYRRAVLQNETGIREELGSSLNVWPSPATTWINVSDPNLRRAEVLDAAGRRVFEVAVVAGGFSIDGLMPGSYVFRSRDVLGQARYARFAVE